MPPIAAERLPRGRHGLPREQVLAAQRRRLLRAMVDEVASSGYASTTAAAVYGRAGVSSRAFYESFTSVQDCFLAAYDDCSATASAALSDPPAGLPAREQLSAMLSTYLHLLDSAPNMARTFLLEVYAAGPQARARRVAVHRRFVALVTRVLAKTQPLSAADLAAVQALVDAVTFAVTLRLADEDLTGLGDLGHLHEQLLTSALRLCPWLDDPEVT